MPIQEPGPSLSDRIRKLEQRIANLETSTGTGKTGTDNTIRHSHSRVDTLLGAGISAPDGTLVTNFNAQKWKGAKGYHSFSRVSGSSAYDDEFDDGSLNAAWTLIQSGVPSYGEEYVWPNHFCCVMGNTNSYLDLRKTVSYPTGVNCSVQAMMRMYCHDVGMYYYIAATNAAETYAVFNKFGRDASGCYWEIRTRVNGTETQAYLLRPGNWGTSSWLSLYRDTVGLWTCQWGQDNWQGTRAWPTNNFAVERVYVGWKYGATVNNVTVAGVDWVRFGDAN